MGAQGDKELVVRRDRIYRSVANNLYVPLCLDFHYDYKLKPEDGFVEGEEIEIVVRRCQK